MMLWSLCFPKLLHPEPPKPAPPQPLPEREKGKREGGWKGSGGEVGREGAKGEGISLLRSAPASPLSAGGDSSSPSISSPLPRPFSARPPALPSVQKEPQPEPRAPGRRRRWACACG